MDGAKGHPKSDYQLRSKHKVGKRRQNKKRVVAERVGFEPTVQETCTPVFETGTLNHSDTSPEWERRESLP